MNLRNTLFAKRKPKVISIPHPHAIIDSGGKVLAIRNYPRTTKSSAVIPISDGQRCKIGWYWTGSKFQEPQP